MTPAPPRWIERLAGWLTPPSQRENVLGDFRERYRRPGQYFFEVLATLPWVLWSEVRRTTPAALFLFEALMVLTAVLNGPRLTSRAAFRDALWVFPFWTTALIVAALVLLRAYRSTRTSARVFVEPGLAFCLGVCANVALRPIWPGAAAPFEPLAAAAFFGWILIAVVRAFSETGGNELAPLQSAYWSGKANSSVSLMPGAFLLVLLSWSSVVDYRSYPTGAVLVSLACWLTWRTYSLRVPTGVSSAPRGVRLKRRRDAMATLWTWYLGPLLCGLTLFVITSPIVDLPRTPERWPPLSPFVVVSLIWCRQATRNAARAVEELDREIDANPSRPQRSV